MDCLVEITDKAQEEVKKSIEKKNIPESYALRIGVKGGKGCGALEYVLGFDIPTDKDLKFNKFGINILINKSEMLYLANKKVDYIENENGIKGFVFLDN